MLAVTAEKLKSNLETLVGEMMHLLVSSAHSTLLRESRDCSYLFLGPRGDVVVLPDDAFLHSSCYRFFAKQVLNRFGESMEPGDIFVTNHPYESGVPHVPDLAIIAPVHVRGELAGFTASIAHKSDVGGSVAGSASSSATDLHQEGFLIPLTRLRSGLVETDYAFLMSIFGANIRDPRSALGDADAQLGVTRLGGERAGKIIEKYGLATAIAAMELMISSTADATAEFFSATEPRSGSAVVDMDSNGVDREVPVSISVQVQVAGGKCTIDFSGTAEQQLGPVNIPLPYTESACLYAVCAFLPPSLELNDGVRDCIEIRCNEQTLVNPSYPAPVGASTITQYRIVDAVLEALSQIWPESGVAHSGGSGGAMTILYHRGGRSDALLQYEIFGTGFGGSAKSDGESGVTVYGTNLSVTPIEILELQYPVRVENFELIPDSGGAGQYRGGLAYRRAYRVLTDATVFRRADRIRFAPSGIAGGANGKAGNFTITSSKGEVSQSDGIGEFRVEAGSIITVEGAGGGGFGEPSLRLKDLVESDRENSFISENAAERIYGGC